MNDHKEKFIFLAALAGIALLGVHGGLTQGLAGQQGSAGESSASLISSFAAFSEPVVPAAATANGFQTALSGGPRNVFLRKSEAGDISPRAQVALVADLQTGEIYLNKNSGGRWPMASLTKLMTSAYALDHIAKTTIIPVSLEEYSLTGGDSSRGLRAPERYSLEDLLKAMLAFSSNEAAEAIAKSYGRGDFLEGLNLLAENWGMKQTHFSDPTGLSSANQSTAEDLLIAARRIYEQKPELFEITRHTEILVMEQKSSRPVAFSNINHFAGQADFLGGKTGYTDDAGGNLLSLFSYQKRPVLVLVMGASDRFGETRRLLQWFKNSYNLGL